MNRMKPLREKMGISMKEAAKRLSLPYTTYVNYEKGTREPDSETLIQIADFFGTTIDYLLLRYDDASMQPEVESAPLTFPGSPTIELTPLEKEIIVAYRHADELDQRVVLRTLKVDTEERKTNIPGVG